MEPHVASPRISFPKVHKFCKFNNYFNCNKSLQKNFIIGKFSLTPCLVQKFFSYCSYLPIKKLLNKTHFQTVIIFAFNFMFYCAFGNGNKKLCFLKKNEKFLTKFLYFFVVKIKFFAILIDNSILHYQSLQIFNPYDKSATLHFKKRKKIIEYITKAMP